MSLITVHVYDTSKLEKAMSELNEKVDRIEAKIDAESAQGKAIKEEIAALRLKIDTLLTDTYAKAEVNAALDRIESKISGIVPDEDAPVE